MSESGAEWGHGYMTDIGYTYGFYRHLAPNYLNFSALLAGCRPRRLDGGFTYCELGTGRGLTTNLLAAANPQGEFWANDFNPTHIADARFLAESAELTNITFLEESFEGMPSLDLPQFDFISLHGIYSWISEENRKFIVQFINERLKPAGIVYISYNALPGNASQVPLKQLLSLYAEQIGGDTMTKVSGAVAAVRKLSEASGGYFASAPAVKGTLDRIFRYEETNRQYLAHEYFNRYWNPWFFSDVSAELAEAKLTYIASANLFENNLNACLAEKARKLVEAAPTIELRETLKDYYLNQSFRRDVYMRGTPVLSPQERLELLSQMEFALQADRTSFKGEIETNFGKINYAKEKFDPVLDALASGPKTVTELKELIASSDVTEQELLQVICFWVGTDQLSPACTDADAAAATRVNRTILNQARYDDSLQYFACAQTGSGIHVPWIWQLFILGEQEGKSGDEVPEFAWSILQKQGRKLVRDGKPLMSDEDNREQLRKNWIAFREQHQKRLEHLKLI